MLRTVKLQEDPNRQIPPLYNRNTRYTNEESITDNSIFDHNISGRDPILNIFLQNLQETPSLAPTVLADQNQSMKSEAQHNQESPLLLRLAIKPSHQNVSIDIVAAHTRRNSNAFPLLQSLSSLNDFVTDVKNSLPPFPFARNEPQFLLPSSTNTTPSVANVNATMPNSSSSKDSNPSKAMSEGSEVKTIRILMLNISSLPSVRPTRAIPIATSPPSSVPSIKVHTNKPDVLVGQSSSSVITAVVLASLCVVVAVAIQRMLAPFLARRLSQTKSTTTTGSALPVDQIHVIDDPSLTATTGHASQLNHVEPEIVIHKRERLSTSSVPLPKSGGLFVEQEPELWTIYPDKMQEGEMDCMSNPYRDLGEGHHLHKSSPRDNQGGGDDGEERTVVSGYRYNGLSHEESDHTDELLAVYEEPSYFVDDNPIGRAPGQPTGAKAGTPLTPGRKNILFPSFIYNDDAIELASGSDFDARERRRDSPSSDPAMGVIPSVYDLPSRFVGTNSRGGKAPLSGSTDVESNLSPLKMVKIRPAGGRVGQVTHSGEEHTCTSPDILSEESDDDYGNSIHSYSFSAATFSPNPSKNRNCPNKPLSSELLSFHSPKSLTQNIENSASSRVLELNKLRNSSRSTVTSASSTATTAALGTRSDSFFVRPKTLVSLDELTAEQVKALGLSVSREGKRGGSVYSIDGDASRPVAPSTSNRPDPLPRDTGSLGGRKLSMRSIKSNGTIPSNDDGLVSSASDLSETSRRDGSSTSRPNPVDDALIGGESHLSRRQSGSHQLLTSYSRAGYTNPLRSPSSAVMSSKSQSTSSNRGGKEPPTAAASPVPVPVSVSAPHSGGDAADKKKKFFRCLSPRRAVHFFIRGAADSKQASKSGAPLLQSPPKTYSSLHASKTALKNGSNPNPGGLNNRSESFHSNGSGMSTEGVPLSQSPPSKQSSSLPQGSSLVRKYSLASSSLQKPPQGRSTPDAAAAAVPAASSGRTTTTRTATSMYSSPDNSPNKAARDLRGFHTQ